MTKQQIAQVAHEVNKAFCSSIGDDSQPSWEDAPEWQKSSAINGVQFHLDNPEASPSASHESWLKQKEEEGWVYGPVKNPETKEHPCFVPYDQLPVEQRSKDYLFKQIIHSLKGHLSECNDEPSIQVGERPNKNLPFSYALDWCVNEGVKIQREGWNGKNMWLSYTPGRTLHADKFWASNNKEFVRENGGSAEVGAYLTMKSAQGTIEMGWRPTSMDMFANDWQIVP